MYAECDHLKAYEPNFMSYTKRDERLIEALVYTLNPTRWRFTYDDELVTVYKMIISDGPCIPKSKEIHSDHHIYP